MLNLDKVKKRYNRYICRQCLNQRYNVHLVPDDCIYDRRDDCPRCKQENDKKSSQPGFFVLPM